MNTKSNLIAFLKKNNSDKFIFSPTMPDNIISDTVYFNNTDVTLPLAESAIGVKVKITNQPKEFNAVMSEECTKCEVFTLVDYKTETFSVAFYIPDLIKHKEIHFQNLFLLALNAKDSIGVELKYPNKDFEKYDFAEFGFSKRVLILTPSIELSNKELEDFYNEFEKGGVKLRIKTLEDIEFNERYSPQTIQNLKEFIADLKALLDDSPDAIEDVFQKKIESNMKILDLHAKKYLAHPKGFSLPKGKRNIHNYSFLVPDFLTESYDGTVTLYELERPNKNLITKAGNPTAKFSQAISQVNQWENLIQRNPKTLINLQKLYPDIASRNKRKYVLIYGRSKEFKSSEEKAEALAEQLVNTYNIEIMTFDDFILKIETAIDNISRPKEVFDLPVNNDF